MGKFSGFGDMWDLTKLKEYVEREGILDQFSPEELKDIEEMARRLEKYLKDDNE